MEPAAGEQTNATRSGKPVPTQVSEMTTIVDQSVPDEFKDQLTAGEEGKDDGEEARTHEAEDSLPPSSDGGPTDLDDYSSIFLSKK